MDRRVVRAVVEKENRLRFYDGLSEEQFDELAFKEYYFRSSQLEKEKSENLKHLLVSASYTAWQLLAAQGLNKNWGEYQRELGLIEKGSEGAESKKAMIGRAYAIADKIRKKRHGTP